MDLMTGADIENEELEQEQDEEESGSTDGKAGTFPCPRLSISSIAPNLLP